jgi:hypothetical protein
MPLANAGPKAAQTGAVQRMAYGGRERRSGMQIGCILEVTLAASRRMFRCGNCRETGRALGGPCSDPGDGNENEKTEQK